MAAMKGSEVELDDALLLLLRCANGLYAEQQQGAKSLRRGFLDMAKARQSLGHGSVSALDCREDLRAKITVNT